MRTFVKLVCIPALVWLSCAPAQAYQSWVASYGTDSASCTREAPCATFSKAISQINSVIGGEVACVDSGHFGGASITHSVTINCESAIGSSSVDFLGADPFSVAIAATDVVI